MRKKWIGWFTFFALLAFLIPITPWFGAPKQRHSEHQTQIAKTKALSAETERTLKLSSIERDMELTASLCSSECSKELGKLIALDHTDPRFKQQVTSMMQKRQQILYVQAIGHSSPFASGKIPAAVKSESAPLMEQAAKAIKKGEQFESKSFIAAGERYMVLGVPHTELSGQGIVGLIHQSTVGEVHRHQMRNLRLVPYPSEGHYRVESVLPNTTKDITVRTGEDNENASHYHINEVVVRFHQDPDDQQLQQIRSDISAITENKLGYTFVFRSERVDTKQMIDYFQQNWNPLYVEPHYLYLTNDHITSPQTMYEEDATPIIPNDVLYSKYQWNLPSIEAGRGWNLSKGSNAVYVGVLDTGVQRDHPDLQGKLLNGTNIIDPSAKPEDDVGHGTHVAGIIAASVNNGEGVAGLTWYNKVMPVKVLDNSGAGSTYSVAQGLIWAADHGAKVINMSLGNYAQAEFLHDAIKYAYDKDVLLVAASGNDNTDRPGFPAAYPEVLAVAATDANDHKASYSNYGDYIDVAAPGDNIASTYLKSQYASLSGTSMASPHVAALGALIRSENPSLTNVQVMDIIRKTAKDIGPPGKDKETGYGEIDIVKALETAGNAGDTGNTTGDPADPDDTSEDFAKQMKQILFDFSKKFR